MLDYLRALVAAGGFVLRHPVWIAHPIRSCPDRFGGGGGGYGGGGFGGGYSNGGSYGGGGGGRW